MRWRTFDDGVLPTPDRRPAPDCSSVPPYGPRCASRRARYGVSLSSRASAVDRDRACRVKAWTNDLLWLRLVFTFPCCESPGARVLRPTMEGARSTLQTLQSSVQTPSISPTAATSGLPSCRIGIQVFAGPCVAEYGARFLRGTPCGTTRAMPFEPQRSDSLE